MLQELLAFLQVGEHDRRNAKLIWSIVEPAAGRITEAFYAEVLRTDINFGIRPDMIDRLQAKQLAYWSALFDSRFDAEYMRQASIVGLRHKEFGVTPQWYVAGYTKVKWAFSRRLDEVAAPAAPELRHTLEKYTAIDMGLALSSYSAELLD